MKDDEYFEVWEYHDDKVAENNEFMSKIYWGDHLSITEDVFYKGHPLGSVFFKVFRLRKRADYNTIEGICRISMITPEYISGYDSNIELTNDEIDEIINMFKNDSYYRWRSLILQTNLHCKALSIPFQFDSVNFPMPNYNLLKKG